LQPKQGENFRPDCWTYPNIPDVTFIANQIVRLTLLALVILSMSYVEKWEFQKKIETHGVEKALLVFSALSGLAHLLSEV
jgi:hypothetical protein